jgi:glycyl-tRNA synthetase
MMMQINDKSSLLSAKQLVDQKIAANQIMAYFLVRQWEFYRRVGITESKMRLRVLDPKEIPHYSKGNIDMEVETSFGAIETIGNAYRTDFDLSQHSKHSGTDMSVFVESEKKKVMPHVFELSMGVDRLFYCILEHCFRDKDQKDETGNQDRKLDAGCRKLGTGKDWEWFDFPPEIAPYHVAVFPLMSRDGLDTKSKEVVELLRCSGLDVDYRESGSIGRRYARADEIGIAYAITVDYDTLKDETVTIRYRNDGKQERIKISECVDKLKENIKTRKVTL